MSCNMLGHAMCKPLPETKWLAIIIILIKYMKCSERLFINCIYFNF
jgi:hypothetical protein